MNVTQALNEIRHQFVFDITRKELVNLHSMNGMREEVTGKYMSHHVAHQIATGILCPVTHRLLTDVANEEVNEVATDIPHRQVLAPLNNNN